MTKVCSSCHQEKDINCFGYYGNGVREYREPRCYECKRQKALNYYHKNSEKYLASARKVYDRRKCEKHGVTIDWLKAKQLEQNNCCAICGQPENGRRLSIDHDHSTNQIRGLLCQKCNFFIGLAKDNTKNLTNAIAYLEKYKNR